MKSYEAGKVKGRGGSREELLEIVIKWRFGLNWTTPTLMMKNTCTFHSFPPFLLWYSMLDSFPPPLNVPFHTGNSSLK